MTGTNYWTNGTEGLDCLLACLTGTGETGHICRTAARGIPSGLLAEQVCPAVRSDMLQLRWLYMETAARGVDLGAWLCMLAATVWGGHQRLDDCLNCLELEVGD
jgi:hypothetical protein